MIKIAIFQEDLGFGGIQKALLNLLNNLDYTKYEIDLYLFSKINVFDNRLTDKVNIIYPCKNNFILKYTPFNIAKLFKPKTKINKCYDFAIDYNSYQSITALFAIETKSTKKIMYIHNNIMEENRNLFKYRFRSFFLKSKYKYFDTFIGVSEGVINPFKEYSKETSKEYHVLPNIVDGKEIINLSHQEHSFKINNNKYNLISVGRLVHQKGYDIMIDVIKKIIKKRKDVHLYIIGDGPDYNKIYKLIKKNNLLEYITLLGAKKNPFKYMKMMNGFLFTSRYEGQGIVLLEAKCLGLDLYFPKHLEKYQKELKGNDNIINDIIVAKKKNKKIDNLIDYNKDIIKDFEKIFRNT